MNAMNEQKKNFKLNEEAKHKINDEYVNPTHGAPQGYPGYVLLRAGSFGGISRFDAAFLLLWLAAAIFRFGFIVRAVRLLCERLAEGPVNAEAAR